LEYDFSNRGGPVAGQRALLKNIDKIGETVMRTQTSRRILGGCIAMILLAASVSAGAQAPNAQGSAPSLGTLEYGTNLFYPQGCAHNGTTVVCTFVFVHQAETQTIAAGVAGSQLTGIQFVDDGHVPHNPSAAYFVDRYGMRQHVLTVNRADQGTMMVEFPMVDTRVSSGELHLATQMLGNIPVGQGGAGPAVGTPNMLAAGGAQASAPSANSHAQGQGQDTSGCNTPQMANTSACKLSNKINNATTQTTSAANAMAAPVNAAKSFLGLFQQQKPAAPAPGTQTPQQ
jgi:hypothetical protein